MKLVFICLLFISSASYCQIPKDSILFYKPGTNSLERILDFGDSDLYTPNKPNSYANIDATID